MKPNRSRNILWISCLYILLIPACTVTSSKDPSRQAGADSSGVDSASGGQESIGLGSIGYTVDESLSKSDTFDISTGMGFSLVTTDANGYRWSLYIPPGALWENQTITMTPFATIDTSRTDAKIVSGVRLEPDGLQFMKAVTLTVTPPDISDKTGMVFSFNQDGSDVKFAPTAGSRGDSIGYLWHFSSAGYIKFKLDIDILRNLVKTMAIKAMEGAKKFLNDGTTPTPDGAPQISMFCRGTEKNPEQGEAYEWYKGFIGPYEEYLYPLLLVSKKNSLVDVEDLDNAEILNTAKAILRKAEVALKPLGDQYAKDKPPDRLVAAIYAAVQINSMIRFLGGESFLSPEVPAFWSETLRDYYLKELADKHDYRAFPGILKMNRDTTMLGGYDLTDQILSAMTFEVRMDTSYSAKWISGDNPIQTGDVVQAAVVKNIQLYIAKEEALWGDIDNVTMTAKSGTFWTPTSGSTSLAGMQDTNTLWLKNWDACVTNTFDVVVGAFLGNKVPMTQTGALAGTATEMSFEKYWWKNAGAFIFSIPIKNLDPNMGELTVNGSGSKEGGKYTCQGMIHMVLSHTPQ
jgi:hypothetical protein